MKNFRKERAEARKKAKELVSKMTLMEKQRSSDMTRLQWNALEFPPIIIGMRLCME